MTTVFWPLDVSECGFIYGWTHVRTACVAGVLHAHTLVDAETILAEVLRAERVQACVEICGVPIILGYCSSPSSIHVPPDIKDPKSCLTRPHHFVYYRRHSMRSLRFYAVDNALPQTNQDTPMHACLANDFTRFRSASYLASSNIQVLIGQWNSARLLDTAIKHHQNGSLRKRHPHTSHFRKPSLLVSIPDKARSYLSNLWPIPLWRLSKLKEFSFTACQIETRLSVLWFLLNQRPVRRGGDVRTFSQKYNEYYNSLWVVLNDIIIGVAFRQFLCQNRSILNQMIMNGLEGVLAHRVQRILLWLDSWPAGLKLNTELSRFYSHGFISLIAQWTELLSRCFPLLPVLNSIVEGASLVGMTMAVSLCLDFLSLLTIHFHVCYLISSVIYHHILILAGSLWNLFRGKRYNVLRNRIDPWDYDIDQLLLGTILFTLAAHLFPTMAVYYVLFALIRLSLIGLYATGETLLAFMNHFPLFVLLLRVKDPLRLPGDAYLLVKRTSAGCSVVLMSSPLPIPLIFAQYAALWRQLAQHYHPIRLGRRILQGRVLATFTHPSVHLSAD